MSYGLLIDITNCIGCEACVDACHESHGHPETDNNVLSGTSYTMLGTTEIEDEERYIRKMCMHCEEPSCASVCPVGAFTKTEEGPVIYNAGRCIGCRYCMIACPFDVPRYEWDKTFPLVQKCDMCIDRIRQNKIPACAEACPAEATTFGKREELIKIAKERIRNNPDDYEPYIYGINEAGGTSVLFIAPASFEKLGFKVKGYQQDFPQYTWQVMREIPNAVAFGGVFFYGLWWIINRREKVQKIEVKNDGNDKVEGKHE